MALSNSTDRFNGVIASLAIKVRCVVASDADLTLEGEQTVAGIAVVALDRVLVMAQTNPIENGIYDVSANVWTRSADWDGNRDVQLGTVMFAGVLASPDGLFQVSSPAGTIRPGVDAVTIVETSVAGGSLGTTVDSTLRYNGVDAFVENLNLLVEASGRVTLVNAAPIRWLDALAAPVEIADFLAVVPGGTPVTDPDVASVVLLVTSESDQDGDSGFTDDTGNHVFTSFTSGSGVAEVSNAQSKFGLNSLHCDDIAGPNNAYFTTPDNTDFDLGSADFTFEFHWRTPEDSAVSRDCFGKGTVGGSNRQWRIQMSSAIGAFRTVLIGSTDGSSNDISGSAKLWGFGAFDTWYHVAVCRDGNNLRFFVDGAQVGSTDDLTGQTFLANTAPFYMFGADAQGSAFEQYYDNIRFTPGVARYTGGFTPPAAPYDGSVSVETAVWGDPAYNTRIDGAQLDIAGAYTLPVVDGSVGQILQTDGAGGVTFQTNAAHPDPVLLGNGSAGAPTYSFSADPNTGVYGTGNDFLRFSAGAVNSVIVTATAMTMNVAGGASMVFEGMTSTNPGFTVTGAADTGMAVVGDIIHLIGGGVELMRLTEAGTNQIEILNCANGLRINNAGGSDYIAIYHDGTDAWLDALTTTDLNISNNFTRAQFDCVISMVERASPAANVAGVGQLWNRSSAPTRLTYTDDTDVDQLLDPSMSETNVQNGNYTLLITDKGKTISKESGGAGETITIPANASVAFQIGTFVSFNNDGGGDLSIAITTDTLVFADDNTTGTRTLADGGYAVAQKVAATTWKIAGGGLT